MEACAKACIRGPLRSGPRDASLDAPAQAMHQWKPVSCMVGCKASLREPGQRVRAALLCKISTSCSPVGMSAPAVAMRCHRGGQSQQAHQHPTPTKSCAAQQNRPSAVDVRAASLAPTGAAVPPTPPRCSRVPVQCRASSAGPKRTKRVSFEEGSRSLPLASPRRSSLGGRPGPDHSLMARIMSQLPDLDDHMQKQVRSRAQVGDLALTSNSAITRACKHRRASRWHPAWSWNAWSVLLYGGGSGLSHPVSPPGTGASWHPCQPAEPT